ncbi:LOW QUALITY PROTEIN: fibroleukin-like [Salvelinus sp. IW2-2015]|uniref:LOW QUALITY PROTEIN: fibroleukin-like n=1 Tax=Salvelinus sp. IW2-2015 TaxID=2691554 RepID=UPI000CEAE22D|nr:LOW QUALITY PROTEIN: fibroleukin-like [Salvelinus alpinus]
MRLVVLCVVASTTLLLAVPWSSAADPGDGAQRWDKVQDKPGTGEVSGGCPVRMKPSGQCGEEDDCPYQITLPPLTIQLPKQFRMLEKTMKELQSLKETVNRLKRDCLECRQQADQSLQRDSGEAAGGPGTGMGPGFLEIQSSTSKEERGDGGTNTGPDGDGIGTRTGSGTGKGTGSTSGSVFGMQVKMNKMSSSLRNARGQITALQGRLEELSLINMRNVEAMVDSKVENITGVINKLSNNCNHQCAVQPSPQFIIAPKDCSDYNMLKERRNGVYRVTPDPRNGTFEVYCDMESFGGSWTLVQQRLNGTVSFNRSWAEYKRGFGDPRGEFWLGNDRIHLLTKAKDMVLRIELEDFQGVREYAKFDQFYVANEFLRYRLSISGYSGTAGNALHMNKHFNHDQKFFTTPDRDNDMYPSGNCGAYYSSGWWFDACMSANLNGKYYHKRYKGVRNGIFWGTWHNMSSEAYPTNYRQAFKTVKMMIRPKNYAP